MTTQLNEIDLFKTIDNLNEGWAIYESWGDDGWEWRIERHDDQKVFSNDGEAVKFVVKKALEGSVIHKDVIRFMVENAKEKEFKFLLTSLSI